jgi:hypothetical protein
LQGSFRADNRSDKDLHTCGTGLVEEIPTERRMIDVPAVAVRIEQMRMEMVGASPPRLDPVRIERPRADVGE